MQIKAVVVRMVLNINLKQIKLFFLFVEKNCQSNLSINVNIVKVFLAIRKHFKSYQNQQM